METLDAPDPVIVREVSPLRRATAAFTPPLLPPTSTRAFRSHMAYTLLDALTAGILSNVPLMAVRAMHASDAQLQIPIAMTSVGLFASVVMGFAMAPRQKKPFVLIPGLASGLSALLMAWMSSVEWFLCIYGLISIFDFSIRPAIPSILRIVYPNNCRSHVAGTLRQYASIAFLGSSLFFSWLLALSGEHIAGMIRLQLTLAGLATLGAFACFWRLPDRGDGSSAEADISDPIKDGVSSRISLKAAIAAPLKDKAFLPYLGIFLLFCLGNLFYMGIVPVFFTKDLKLGYVQSTLLIHILPALSGFVFGGRLTSWFDRTSVWRAYSVVMLLWGLDPVLLATFPNFAVVLFLARICRGPATVGSMVLAVYTGVHRFARPGPETTCYMSTLFFVNGIARLASPIAVTLIGGGLSHRAILLYGGFVVLTASALYRLCDSADSRTEEMRGQLGNLSV